MPRKKADKPESRPVKPSRRQPPPNYVTASEAANILGNKMLYKLVKKGAIRKLQPASRRQGFYLRSDVEAARAADDALYGRGIIIERKNDTTFSRATVDDMDGVYIIASELFPHGTTSAEARKPLIAKCPDGNYVVKEQNEIRAFIHIQPLKTETLQRFLSGKIRGKDITANDLDCFETGKSVDILVKSMGATLSLGKEKHRHYTQRLLLGVRNALADLGKEGVIIRKVYATSETETGIALSMHAKMKTIRRLKAPNLKEHEPARYAFELDVATSDLPLLQPYKRAFAEWQRSHSVTQD